jgi:hypothetical protein
MVEVQEKRGWIYRNRKLVAGLIIIFLLSQVIIVVLNQPSDNAVLEINVPRSPIPDSCVYPATYDIDYNTSYVVRGDYAPLINISEEVAVDAAIAFVSAYLPEELLPNLRLIDSGEDYWRGLPTLSTDCWPRWGMTLVSDFIEADVYVNALSGKVVKFTMFSYNATPFSFESINSVEEAENVVIDFLQSENYTLLPDAVYDGASLNSELVQPYYILSFHQRINEVSVGFSDIYFQIDATYGLIEHFMYRWIEYDDIPTDQILPVEEIERIVLIAGNASLWVRVSDIELRFDIMGFNPFSSEFTMRLIYEVYLKPITGIGGDVYTVDAISGEIISVAALFGSSNLGGYVPIFGFIVVFFVGIGYLHVKQRKLSEEREKEKAKR